jgi:predicted metal-dependent enzyme (double-stranded beta helix superfamily)
MKIPASLSRLVDLLKTSVEAGEKLSPQSTKEMVLKAEVKVEDMMAYADFDHPIEDCYGRQLVYHGGKFEVMVMSWNPGDYSSIHNHGYTEWGVVQVFGDTHHFIYNFKDNCLSYAKRELLASGTAIKVNNALIHQMGNATTKPYLTLHVYGSNSLDGSITADAQNFDLEFDRIAKTCGGAFFNLQDEDIFDTQEGITADQDLFMHYAYLLMDYYNRQEQTDKILELKRHLLNKIEELVLDPEGIDELMS